MTLGRLVRVFRDAAGLTQKELASKLGYTNGWVSNLETGQLRPRAEQVRALERTLNAPPGALMEVYEQLDGESLPGWMRDWTNEEAAADVLRWVELSVVPGLLQTEDYARALLKGNESAVAARMQRQEILSRDNPPTLHFVVDETVLLHEIGGAKVMRAQLEHLVNSVSPTQLTVQVVRSSKNPHSLGSFIIATIDDSEVAYVETALRGIVTSARDDVANLTSIWEFIRAFALSQEESIELIKRTMEERWQ
ncbi:helix-turn-helix domain-containing protein [Actinoallomurus iriomotensis]|uniref:Transcriptional regulator n=1 Tax=Actinoallomurus iriomotensis TaxID=478107 RepID=A0A9W6SA09_9ACTN|nr:helix-turn-helix transcriptional regulator [Actinoallomurus iriomotensis]GLY91050.1 transcriptional regulator [Actinoallomurus iriomotensis]